MTAYLGKTRNRVIAYQLDRAAGEFYAFSFPLYVDGIVGPQTWFRLTPETVKKTSQGSGVRFLQNSQELRTSPL